MYSEKKITKHNIRRTESNAYDQSWICSGAGVGELPPGDMADPPMKTKNPARGHM